ncbi:MAG TPA: hypothetical protein VJ935_01160 [Acidimicrobiia bacterium]|nr:hypothetical protein [Acidimicrobiia bacterium]
MAKAGEGLGGKGGSVEEALLGEPLHRQVELMPSQAQPTSVDRIEPTEKARVAHNRGEVDQGA